MLPTDNCIEYKHRNFRLHTLFDSIPHRATLDHHTEFLLAKKRQSSSIYEKKKTEFLPIFFAFKLSAISFAASIRAHACLISRF